MYRLWAEHDAGYALAAAAVCVIAMLSAFAMLGRAQQVIGTTRRIWITLVGVAAGTGMWATHFLGMVAFQAFRGGGFETVGNILSLAAAAAGATLAFALGALWHSPRGPLVGGIVFTLATTAMHVIGMDAFVLPGHIHWNLPVLAASLAATTFIAVLAFWVARLKGPGNRRNAALLLTLAMWISHFAGMASASVVPDTQMQLGHGVMSPGETVTSIVVVLSLVFAAIGGAVLVNDYGTNRALMRLRRLANGTFEGLAVVRDGRILDVNAAFLDLTGASAAGLSGLEIESELLQIEPGPPDARRKGRLRAADGGMIPVEVLVRRLSDAEIVYAVRDLRERHAAEARIRFLAEHDLLTGLLNRAAGRSRLDAAIELGEREEQIAVLRVDIDGLREINEVHGLGGGDVALKAVAARINMTVPKPSIVSRPGGSEFHIIQIGEDQPAAAARLANDLLVQIRAPIPFGRMSVSVTASIGISLYPDDGFMSEVLLGNADMALHRAKSEGRDNYRFFQRDVDDAMRERRMLARELRDVIRENQLRLVYQPIAETATGRIVGFEALVRWEHPTHGLLSPDIFVPIAEENGLIGGLGEWVLTQACREAATWERPLRVAVNLSALQVHEAAMPERVAAVLRATGLDPSRLELEVTETAIFQDTPDALGNLKALKQLGVRIAIDDFGTGYSSLSTLESFPFDKIKIDKGFVENLGRTERADAIVRAIIGLGRSLGISVAAEGVEERPQLDFLKTERCDELQGYIIGRPEPIAAHADLTRHRHAPAGVA